MKVVLSPEVFFYLLGLSVQLLCNQSRKTLNRKAPIVKTAGKKDVPLLGREIEMGLQLVNGLLRLALDLLDLESAHLFGNE